MAETIIAIVGWVAAGLILASYVLLTMGRMTATSTGYQLLNLFGAGGFVLNSGWNGAMPSAVLNVVWAGIAIYGLSRIAAVRRAPREEPLAR